MKSAPHKSGISNWLVFLCFAVFSLQTFSQQNLGRQTILQFDANHSVLKPDAPALKKSVTMAKGKDQSSFVSGVGGVSFDQLAKPASDLKIYSFKMNYVSSAPDGSRLAITINNKRAKFFLPDWLLVPIVKYTESPYYSCVTLFGELNNKALEKQLTDHKGRVINYHPAFDNTLVGVRLAYMDMLIGYSFTTDLPKNSSGKYILGTGEKSPNIAANKNGAYNLSQHFNYAKNKYGQTFRSYVISDYTRQITFNLRQDSLVIDGFPYYYCWRYKRDENGYNIDRVAQDISIKHKSKIKELTATRGEKAAKDWMINKLITLANKYKGNYEFYSEGTFIAIVNLKSNEEKKQVLNQYSSESLLELLIQVEAYMDRDSVVHLKEYSREVSSKPKLFEAANPAVWNASVNTMRYAAFFRYVKANYPEAWKHLLDQVKMLDPQPRIVTPTIMYDPAMKL